MNTKKTVNKQTRKAVERASEIVAREVRNRVPIIKHMLKQMTEEDWYAYAKFSLSGNHEKMAALVLKYKPKV